MFNDRDFDAFLAYVITLPGVSGAVISSHEGDVARSNVATSDDAETLAQWSLGIFLSSEMVAKKTPPDYSRLKFITMTTSECGFCILRSGAYLTVITTKELDALELLNLADSINEALLLKSYNNDLNFAPS